MTGISQDEHKKMDLLRQQVLEMLEKVQEMLSTSLEGLLKYDIKILDNVLKGEDEVMKIYNDLTSSAITSSKGDVSNKAKESILDIVDMAGAVEKIGNCCVWLVEQVEYAVSEKVSFSKEAEKEYRELHGKVKDIISDTAKAMGANDKNLAKSISNRRSDIDRLVETSRANHIDRSARGICGEWAKVRYLDMLNFTKQAAYHCMELAEKISKIN
jgi:Na+/phosphate symporter